MLSPVASDSGARAAARGVTGLVRVPIGMPNVVIIGAMKAGTTALHDLLDRHPDVCMSRPKELNFFFGSPAAVVSDWHSGNWHRGPEWYANHFDPQARLRGESSPGYTSPDHPEVAARMAALLPDARLLYLVRDPVERAISQYLHHWAEKTERRDPDEALLDPGSQYVARGLYYQRLVPFLRRYDRSRIAVVAQEDLSARPEEALTVVAEFLEIEPDRAGWAAAGRPRPAPARTCILGGRLQAELKELFRADAEQLRRLCDREFDGWCV